MQEARQKRPHFVQFCLYPKNQLTVKDPDAGKHERQEEKGTTEDKMVGWHHSLSGHEFETRGNNEGQLQSMES